MPHQLERQRTVILPLPRSPTVNISFHDLHLSVPVSPFSKEPIGSEIEGIVHFDLPLYPTPFHPTQTPAPLKHTPEKKLVLRGLSGTFKSGELSAIMGPSGAGKSTLLNVLTGFVYGDLTGEIRMDGSVIRPGKGKARSMSCYIMQEDFLNPVFTTLEIMTIAAHLKVGSALSDKAKQILVEDILDSLGMGSTLYTKCQKLSGGQKKRLCIALELIDNPPIMYLDEPTTGLDSSTTTQLVQLLKSLARGGRNIVCTIHQPSASVFELFDHSYMVAKGSCLYQGSPKNLVSYLQTIGITCPQYHNPADFMLDVMCGEFGNFNKQLMNAAKDPSWRSPPGIPEERTAKAKEAEANNQALEKTTVLINSPSEFTRLLVLLKRNFILAHRDWSLTYLKAACHIAIGVIIGLLFTNAGKDGDKAISNISYFLCLVVYQSFTSCIPAVLKFPAEINILKKEQFNNWYKLRTYFIAFIMTNLPLQMFFSFLFVTTSYYLSSQLLDFKMFFKFCLASQFTIVISECLGLALGTADNPVNGLFWGSVILAIHTLLGGFLAILTHMPRPLYYVSYINFMRYVIQTMSATIYGNDRDPLECPPDQIYCHYRYPDKVLNEMGMIDLNYWGDSTILALFCVAHIFNAYFCLHRKITKR